MICPVCNNTTSIHHEIDGSCFLMCGHIGKRNPGATTWTGFIDNELKTLDFTDRDLVPTGNMRSDVKWTNGKCPVCFGDSEILKIVHKPDGAHTQLVCGHFIALNFEDKHEKVKQPDEIHTVENIPERGIPTDVAPNICSVCGRPGGDYRVTFWPKGYRTCGHNFVKETNGVVHARNS